MTHFVKLLYGWKTTKKSHWQVYLLVYTFELIEFSKWEKCLTARLLKHKTTCKYYCSVRSMWKCEEKVYKMWCLVHRATSRGCPCPEERESAWPLLKRETRGWLPSRAAARLFTPIQPDTWFWNKQLFTKTIALSVNSFIWHFWHSS